MDRVAVNFGITPIYNANMYNIWLVSCLSTGSYFTQAFPLLTYSNVKLIVVGWFLPGEAESVAGY